MCALLSSDDLNLVYGVKHALEARGMEALVFGGASTYARHRKPTTPVAYAVGIDTWPDEAGEAGIGPR